MKMNIRIILIIMILFNCTIATLSAEDGYDLWLRYKAVKDSQLKNNYALWMQNVILDINSIERTAIERELGIALPAMLGNPVRYSRDISGEKALFITSFENGTVAGNIIRDIGLYGIGKEGYVITNRRIGNTECIVIAGITGRGALYGVFHFLRLLQMSISIDDLNIHEDPGITYRLLNHWDNLDRTVERGYAGFSIWDWHRLPGYTPQRYIDYARANASIGINGTVLTNVNANSWVLTTSYLEKVAALADLFRPYGIKVFLTARFSSPIELGKLKTADPLDKEVQEWWKNKSDEIYSLIPDFGGFLVKANSEGQPGPQDYGRNHADGANMLADAVDPHGGVVIWRAFVYSQDVPDDRAKQAYNEFKPLDGKFRDNVIIQVKNGAIDFQPREPFHPLFGATPSTNLGMEFQITQEYLGQGTNLVYLAGLFKECLDADTYVKGKGSEVSKVIDGSLFNSKLTCMAGVSNVGNDRNWTGHYFGQANWYAFGRLAWDHELSSGQIAEEWLKLCFSVDGESMEGLKKLMLNSREICVNYMTPLGLHHIMGRGHHYGPGPWVTGGRPDWTSVYYHQADEKGIGFDRSESGSNAVSQYSKEVGTVFGDPEKCPEKYLLWFHHLDWDYRLKSGKTLWEEICYHYYGGAEDARKMCAEWDTYKDVIDRQRFDEIKSLLEIQADEAAWWRDACVLYFQSKSGLPIPGDLEPPSENLEYFMKLRFPYAPGIRPSW